MFEGGNKHNLEYTNRKENKSILLQCAAPLNDIYVYEINGVPSLLHLYVHLQRPTYFGFLKEYEIAKCVQ